MVKSVKSEILSGQLKSPVQRGYSQEKLDNLFLRIEAPTLEDAAIYFASSFFYEQLSGLRSELEETPPPSGTTEELLKRAIGVANRDYLLLIEYPDVETSPKLVSEIIEKEVALAGGINHATAGDITETLIDGLRFELHALSVPTCNTAPIEDSEEKSLNAIAKRANLSVFYHALEEQWLDCFHLEYTVSAENQNALIHPQNDSTVPQSWAIGEYRDHAILLEIAGRYMQLVGSKFSPDPIRGIRLVDEKFNCLPADEKVRDQINVNKLLAAQDELVGYFGEPLEYLGGLSVREMISCWSALSCLAHDYVETLLEDTEVNSLRDLERLCPVVKLHEILDPLRASTGLSKKQSLLALDNLSWRSSRDSLWHRPLISLNKGKKFLMLLPALIGPNLLRSVEYWLSEGGQDLGLRGNEFEYLVRKDLKSNIEKNETLGDAGALEFPAKPPRREVGDIDLVAWIGNTILIGETKCLLRPSTSHERFQYGEKLTYATDQVKRKSAFILQNPEWLIQLIEDRGGNIDSNEIRVVSCIVVNNPVGSLRTVDGVPVVDQHILHKYFEDGFVRQFTDLENEDSAPKRRFYQSEKEAEQNLSRFLMEPDHLKMYKDGLEYKRIYQPSFCEKYSRIGFLVPVIRVKIEMEAQIHRKPEH